MLEPGCKGREKYPRLAEGRGSRRESTSLRGNALNRNEAVSTSRSLQTSPQEWVIGAIGKRVKDKALKGPALKGAWIYPMCKGGPIKKGKAYFT